MLSHSVPFDSDSNDNDRKLCPIVNATDPNNNIRSNGAVDIICGYHGNSTIFIVDGKRVQTKSGMEKGEMIKGEKRER